LETYDPPGGIGVRVDDALRQGDELVTDYDSMIAKLIVWGSDREECLARSKRALAEYDLEGVVTIVPFHRLMLDDERFVAGTHHTTKYLDEELDEALVADAQEKWGTESSASGDDDEEVSEREFTVEVNGKRSRSNWSAAHRIPIRRAGWAAAAAVGEQRPPQAKSDDGRRRRCRHR